MQSLVKISTSTVVKERQLGPITFKYACVWCNSLVEAPDTPQPTVVTNTGLSYLGSLTTPDFQENIVWIEESYKMTVSVRKMASLGDREVFRPAMVPVYCVFAFILILS